MFLITDPIELTFSAEIAEFIARTTHFALFHGVGMSICFLCSIACK
jgi:hypothetical protein